MPPEPDPKTVRPRGRPRVEIDPDAVADALAELFEEGGLEAVSFAETAKRLSVSRATLYRSVPSKEHLLSMLFDRSAAELLTNARNAAASSTDPGRRLVALMRVQVEAAIRMRRYTPVFFGTGELPPDVLAHRSNWNREFEQVWVDVVSENMTAGLIPHGDPVVTARLLLGSGIWVSRWYRPAEGFSPEQITEVAARLIGALQGNSEQ